MEQLKVKLAEAEKRLMESYEAMGEALSKDELVKAKECRELHEFTKKEIENLKAEIKSAEEKRALEEENAKAQEELRELKAQLENNKKEGNKSMETRSYEKSIEKLNEGKTVSTRAIVVDNAQTEAVVPEAFMRDLETLKTSYGSLKQYCDVYKVTNPTGKRMVNKLGGKLQPVTAGQKLPEGTVNFENMLYDVNAFGEIVTVDRQLMADASVDIFATIREGFAEKSANTESEAVLKAISANAQLEAVTASAGTTTLLDQIIEEIQAYHPNVRRGVMIFATGAFRTRLINASYIDGRKDDRVDRQGERFFIDGHEVIEIDATLLPTGDEEVKGYIVNPKSIKFFDRDALEMSVSNEYSFGENAVAIRCIERLDVKGLNDEMVKGKKIK